MLIKDDTYEAYAVVSGYLYFILLPFCDTTTEPEHLPNVGIFQERSFC